MLDSRQDDEHSDSARSAGNYYIFLPQIFLPSPQRPLSNAEDGKKIGGKKMKKERNWRMWQLASPDGGSIRLDPEPTSRDEQAAVPIGA